MSTTTKPDSSYTDSSSTPAKPRGKAGSALKRFINNFGGLFLILVCTVVVCLWFMHFDGSFDQPDMVTNFFNIGSDYDPTN